MRECYNRRMSFEGAKAAALRLLEGIENGTMNATAINSWPLFSDKLIQPFCFKAFRARCIFGHTAWGVFGG